MITQIQRIKDKLTQVQAIDTNLDVFGADSHQYTIGTPLTEEEVQTIEQTYNFVIPEAYRLFITTVGYGNPSEEAYLQSAAGPYYGLLPIVEGLKELLTENPALYLSQPCMLTPTQSEDEWQQLANYAYEGDISDEEYDKRIGTLFAGLLPIGTQGCGITTLLITTGPHIGRIVYTNDDYQPFFAFETHFLDWYERWLDEIISGDLLSPNAGWFAYSKGGTSEQLWQETLAANTDEEKLLCLKGLLGKKENPQHILQEIKAAIPLQNTEVALALLRILTKYNYPAAKDLLFEYANIDLLAIVQNVYWYAKEDAISWVATIEQYLPTVTDTETFNFCTYLLTTAKIDYAPILIPRATDTNPKIRSQVFYTLGQLNNKVTYIEVFKKGLQDKDIHVLLQVLQAINKIKDESLLPYYKEIAIAYPPSDEDYIATNLDHCLKNFGLTRVDLLK
ncbi:MAG: SMI1/KNR4 family protein [Flavobacteriaceae bacterium]|jgi:hypothetical protein|nr:SMI1/KNR4 family protein [Flavobacteriaceae bacterium]